MSNSASVISTVVIPILSAIFGGVLVLIGQAYFQGKQNSAVRDQIVFLLRSVSVSMAMARDYPKYFRLTGFDRRLERLIERVLSTDGTVALRDSQRSAILDALSETEESAAFIQTDRETALGAGDAEYLAAAASRAFAKLEAAREILGDNATLTKPVDPRALHNWQPGAPIK